MPRDSAGVYSLPPVYLATTGDPITAVQHNTPLEDVAAALTGPLLRDGTLAMTAALKMAGNKITGMAAGAAAGEAVEFNQLAAASTALSAALAALAASLNPAIAAASAAAAGANANANTRVAKAGDTMTGDLMIQGGNPGLLLHYPGLSLVKMWVGGDNIWRLTNSDGSGTRLFVQPSGAVWTPQVGDWYSFVVGQASAYAENARVASFAHADDIGNYRVHRIRMDGYGESDIQAWAVDAPNVITDCYFAGYSVIRRWRTLQQFIPAFGGWINVS